MAAHQKNSAAWQAGQGKHNISTAQSINMRFVTDMFFAFLFLDILAACLAVFGAAYSAESHYISSWALVNVPRAFASTGTGNIFAFIMGLQYTFTADNGFLVTVDAGEFLTLLSWMFVVIFTVEGFLCLRQLAKGPYHVRQELHPLNTMALTTQAIGSGWEKYHYLENAISHINPLATGTRLHTGDEDLQSLEKAINGLLDRQEQAYRQQNRFVSDASHELRTPIAVIQGYANMLDRWGKEDEHVLEEGITAIKNEAARMNSLVEQLLFLARSDSGKTPLEVDGISLADMVKEVQEESAMIDSTHIYTFSCAGQPYVLGDVGLLKQTARILIDNAAKYSPEGARIAISAGFTADGAPYFQVQDEGEGIEPGALPHLFERFFRADSARERKTGGSGLGLSIANWVVERHGGYFDVYSRLGIGTRVRVVLPIGADGQKLQ